MRNEEAFWKSIEETESQPDQELAPSQIRHLLFLEQRGDEANKARASEILKRHSDEIVPWEHGWWNRRDVQELMDEYAKSHGYSADICKNCGYDLKLSDKYCKCCGAKVEEDMDLEELRFFELYHTMMLYGPPPVGYYVCDSCGNKWGTRPMDEERYCPECGKNTVHFLWTTIEPFKPYI